MEIKNKVVYKKLTELSLLNNNPRVISKENMDKLKKSIKNNPDYFEARPIICSDRIGKLVILAGKNNGIKALNRTTSFDRLTVSFEYIGNN